MEHTVNNTNLRRMLIAMVILIFCFVARVSAQNEFITTWETTTANESITIPTHSGSTYDYSVDWGDGTIESNVIGSISHNFASPGLQTISISGVFPRIFFNNQGGSDKEKIREVLQWGNISWSSMQTAFYGCQHLNVTANDSPDLSGVTSLRNMFRNADLSVANVQNWDVSNVQDMVGLFRNTEFNASLNTWDVSNVELFHFMFFSANNFNGNISNWDVSNATNMRDMFGFATAFNQDLSNWNVSNVTNMLTMFQKAESYNQDMSNWDVSAVTNMKGMFIDAMAFDRDISSWNVGNATDMFAMFAGAFLFNQDLSSWDVSEVTDMEDMFYSAKSFNQNIGNWDVSSVTTMKRMFYNALSFDQNLGNWDVSMVSDMSEMFANTGLSQSNYDSLLIGWNSLPNLQNTVPFDAGSSSYCLGASAREGIITNFGWEITDNGYDPIAPVVICPMDQTQFVDPGALYTVPDYFASGEATASDNCTKSLSIFTQNPAPGSTIPVGVYTVTLTAEDLNANVGSCSFELTVENILNIEDPELLSNQITVYPNPARNTITIANPLMVPVKEAIIYDLLGRTILNFDLAKMEFESPLDISTLTKGNYFIAVLGTSSKVTKRMIKI